MLIMIPTFLGAAIRHGNILFSKLFAIGHLTNRITGVIRNLLPQTDKVLSCRRLASHSGVSFDGVIYQEDDNLWLEGSFRCSNNCILRCIG